MTCPFTVVNMFLFQTTCSAATQEREHRLLCTGSLFRDHQLVPVPGHMFRCHTRAGTSFAVRWCSVPWSSTCSCSRPHVPLPHKSGNIVCCALVLCSVIINASRFMEYEFEVLYQNVPFQHRLHIEKRLHWDIQNPLPASLITNPHWGRILGHHWDTSSKCFPRCYSQSLLRWILLPPLPPPSKSGLKLVCTRNIVYGNLKSENFKDYTQRNLNEIVRSWIRLPYSVQGPSQRIAPLIM